MEQYAGFSICHATLKAQRQLGGKSASRRHLEVDFSLVQPRPGPAKPPDASLRLDPAAIKASAGGLAKVDPFFENGRPAVALLAAERTDPITHFKYEGKGHQREKMYHKRMGYSSMAAASTWQCVHDPWLSEQLKHPDIRPQMSVAADGVRHYNIWGREDLRKPATKDLIKCERPPEDGLILFNDVAQLPYCMREGGLTAKRPVHGHWKSQGIWDCMRDEQYMQQLSIGCTPADDDPGQQRKYKKTKLSRMRERRGLAALSDDEAPEGRDVAAFTHGQRTLRSARSSPPERRHADFFAFREASTGSATHRDSGQRSAAPRQRPASASAPSSRSAASGSRTPGRASSCMSPVSITNAWASARRNSVPRNAKPRGSTAP